MAKVSWQDALDSQLTAMFTLKDLISKAEQFPRQMRQELVPGWKDDLLLLKHSTPFAWSRPVINAVMAAGQSIPLDTRINSWNMDTTAAWWKFDFDLPIQTLTAGVGVCGINFGWVTVRDVRQLERDEHGKLIRQDERHMSVTCWCPGLPEIIHPIMASQTFRWDEGLTLGEMLESNRESHRALYGITGKWRDREQIGEEKFMYATETIARFILAGLAWINQRILVAAEPRIESLFRDRYRKLRKQQIRESEDNAGHVKVVNLRRAEYATPHEPGDGMREYSCRWIVDGHWRNQACGTGLTDRRLVYIMPYMKGPEDAPLKVPDITVYRVSR